MLSVTSRFNPILLSRVCDDEGMADICIIQVNVYNDSYKENFMMEVLLLSMKKF